MRGLAAVVAILVAALAVERPAAASHVDPDEVIYVLPPDRIPAITNPTFSSSDWLALYEGAAERVVGVVVNGDARAYPVRILNWHEIVDDVIGGVPIAVTYCPLCGTGLAFERTLADGTTLTFKVSGRLYKNDLVMYDAESGPDSWWSQILGEAITGPYHGTKLALVAAETLSWGDFRARHPDARLLARPTHPDGSFPRDYEENPYAGYEYSSEILFPPGFTDTESGLHAKDFVLLLQVEEEARAYPYRFLSTERVVNDVLGGTPIVVTFALDSAQAFVRGSRTFRYDAGSDRMVDETGGRWDLFAGTGTGESLPALSGVRGFWFAIFDFEMERAGSVDVYGIGVVGHGSPKQGRASPWPIVAAVGVVVLLGYWLARRRRASDRRQKNRSRW